MFRRAFAFPARPSSAAVLLAPRTSVPPKVAKPYFLARQFTTSTAAANVRVNKPYLFVDKPREFEGQPLPPLKMFEPPAEYYELKPDPVYDPLEVKMVSEQEIRDVYRQVEEALHAKKDILPHGLPDGELRLTGLLQALGQPLRSLDDIRNEVLVKLAYRDEHSIRWRRRIKNNPAWLHRLNKKRRHRARRILQIEKQTMPW